MGVIKKLAVLGTEQGANYMLGHSLASNAVTNILGNNGQINVLEEYFGFAWKCINVRAESLATERIFMERLVNGKWIEDPSHEFNQVLAGSESQYDLYEFLIAHQVSLDLYGESFWYFSKGDKTGRPMGRYLLNPNFTTVYVANGQVTGYVYQMNGENVVLDVDEVAHYRVYDPNPWREFRGLGPMQAAGWFVKSGRYINTYVNNYLENNAIPAGVIVAKGQVDDADWKLFKEQWSQKYSGVDNGGKTGFIRGTDMDFVKTGLSLGEADFEKMKTSSRDEIMAMFGVSGPMLGIYENSNRASATTAKGLFATTFTETALNRLSSKLTRKVQLWYGSNFRVSHSNPVPEDTDQQLALYDKGTNKWVTANEARAAYGLDPIKGGDQLFILNTQQPITSAGALAPPAAKSLKVTLKTKSREFSQQTKEDFRSETEKIQLKYEQEFLQKAEPILEAQKKMVLDQLQPKKVVDTQFDTQQQANALVDEVMPVLLALAQAQGLLSFELINGGEDTGFQVTPVMEQYIKDSIAKACKSFTEETQTKIADALSDGLGAGESLAQIGKRISDIYDEVLGVETPGYRIERLARTEVIKGSNAISEGVYKDSGVVEKKEWFANPGACEYCRALNGDVINLSGIFVQLGGTLEGVDGGSRSNDYETIEHPPAHPNCRCTILPVIR